MTINGKIWLLFEQSGTFKNEFRKLGFNAVDCDIQNNFGETDRVIDLFAEIERAYQNDNSIFDEITQNDLVMAFFPCVFFCENNQLYFTGSHQNLKQLTKKDKADIILKRSQDRTYFYNIALKMFTICDIKRIRLIVENPYAKQHFLIENFPYKATIIDKNRAARGDYFSKPTQYWFVNCEPTNGCSYQKAKKHKKISDYGHNSSSKSYLSERSLISPDYARNFICDYIIGKMQKYSQTYMNFQFDN